MTRAEDFRAQRLPEPGDPAPGFQSRTAANSRFSFDSAAGCYLVLCFLGSGADGHAQDALAAVQARTDLFDDSHASFFGVSVDPDDETADRLPARIPGIRHFWDFDLRVSRLYGVAGAEAAVPAGPTPIARHWVIIDPTMRVLATIPFRADRSDIAEAMALLEDLPPPGRFAGTDLMAPILFLPRVLEPALCRRLINLYETHGGEESGFMREVGGRTVGMLDPGFKRRKDCTIADAGIISTLRDRVLRRIVPEIAKVHQFRATRMERYTSPATTPRTAAISRRIATTPRGGPRTGASPCR